MNELFALLILDQAIDNWVFKMPGLHALLLTENDWKILRDIADILEVHVAIVHILPLSFANGCL